MKFLTSIITTTALSGWYCAFVFPSDVLRDQTAPDSCRRAVYFLDGSFVEAGYKKAEFSSSVSERPGRWNVLLIVGLNEQQNFGLAHQTPFKFSPGREDANGLRTRKASGTQRRPANTSPW
jgi:hypothetical protein